MSRIQGLEVALALALATIGCEGPPPTPPTPDGGGETCGTDAECDDGLFCSGVETCDPDDPAASPRGCVTTPACTSDMQCIEAERRCVIICAIDADQDDDGHDSIACMGDDCDDSDAMSFPGGIEVCDPISRDEDCDPVTLGGTDRDADGFVDAACCNGDRCGDDCADARRDAHPGSTEACEGIDNDCDGAVDEGLLVPMFRDEDFDLHGTAGTTMAVCPGTPGWSLASDDCDDTSPLRHGAQLEICDGLDNNCNGMTDEAPVAVPWYPDEDGDLFGVIPDDPTDVVISCIPIPGRSTRSSDCDDGDALIHPGSREICNGVDDDCNGRADAPGVRAGDTEDDDLDGEPDRACGGADCDDADPLVYPGATEICNMRDDDCDGAIDGGDTMSAWYVDADRDGFGDTGADAPEPIASCTPQPGRIARGGDCDDGDARIHPRAADGCDGVDLDCDDEIDENGLRFAFFPDADGDGYGSTDVASIVYRCAMPAGAIARTGDCADTDPLRNPAALEQCDGADEDCDAAIDEDSDRMWYVDADDDGHGVGAPIVACMAPPGRVPLGDDCDDGDAGRFPSAAELCNGRDEDCDGTIDDGASASCAGVAHASGTCTAGSCTTTCDTGYDDCDLDPLTGCEADVARSPYTCGACDSVCNPGDTCGTTAVGTCDQSPAVAVFSTEDWAVAVRANGRPAVWGNGNASGATTYTSPLHEPAPMPLTGVAEIEGAADNACARTTAGAVLCWGSNNYGELGDGTRTSRTTPRRVLGIDDAIDVDVGTYHGCAVRATGHVACWGWNSQGELGNGTVLQQLEPVEVVGIDDAVGVVTGSSFSCALRGAPSARSVVCWGDDTNGQHGDGVAGGDRTVPGPPVMGLPGDVVALARISESGQGLCARTGDGRVFCWGYNYSSLAFGLGMSSPGTLTSAVAIPGVSDAVEVVLSLYAGCMRRRGGGATGGELWCWGIGSSTRWIDGAIGHRYVPTRVTAGGSTVDDASSIAVGDERWCAVRTGGTVWCMGQDTYGTLGDGGPPDVHSVMPVRVIDIP